LTERITMLSNDKEFVRMYVEMMQTQDKMVEREIRSLNETGDIMLGMFVMGMLLLVGIAFVVAL
jgi:hypothetical protein